MIVLLQAFVWPLTPCLIPSKPYFVYVLWSRQAALHRAECEVTPGNVVFAYPPGALQNKARPRFTVWRAAPDRGRVILARGRKKCNLRLAYETASNRHSMYELHKLGWHSFQQLCLTVTREVLGQTVQSFLDSRDGGRDGAFAGQWRTQTEEDLSGRFVIQCKFTSLPHKALRLSDVAEELRKVERLVKQNRCDCYLLLTNALVSGVADEGIETAFLERGVKQFRCFGGDWISQQIRDHKRLRMLVPRIYGLGDLSQILDERAYQQARAILDSMKEDLSKVVLTETYNTAVRSLEEHGFVLLLGEPASGKTTLAGLLAMSGIDQWAASTLKLDKAADVVRHWNPNEPSQFFWIDDAFGVTQYESLLVFDWNRVFSKVKAMLDRGARMVFTSRDYIYNRAKKDLKETAFPLLRESQVVIDVRNLTTKERQQILYNHIKLGTQSREFRREVKPYLDELAAHPRFVPETARRLGSPLFTNNLTLTRTALIEFVDQQQQFLEDVIRGLDKDSKAALALIFMSNDALESPIQLRSSEEAALVKLGATLGETIVALTALQNSLVSHVREEGRALWRFRHPTIGDAFASLLLQSAELMDIYLLGAPADKLLSTITCGDVGLKNAVIVPRRLYGIVLDKLSQKVEEAGRVARQSAWHRQRELDAFLTYRADKEFLDLYLKERPSTLERVSRPGLYLDAVSEVGLARRLFDFGLLAEQWREVFVRTVSDYAIEGSDGHALTNEGIQEMFSPEEWDDLLRRVRSELLPNLDEARMVLEDNHDARHDPEEHMQSFFWLLEGIERQFGNERCVLEIIRVQRGQAGSWIASRQEDAERDEAGWLEPDYDVLEHVGSGPTTSRRSVFDDVDS